MGGINHYMMPLWNGEGLATPRYGNIAIDKLFNKMLEMGSSPDRLVAKVFGGAQQLNDGNSVFNIGERNVDIARVMLKEYKIPISGMHVGGNQGRRLRFFTGTGEVWMKLL
jgi:chemotaxis protein CheD